MSLHKSDLATLPYLPSVISRWQAAPHTISPTNYNMVGQFQADILASAADDEDAFHILSCLPTGYGKSLPMLMLNSTGEADAMLKNNLSEHIEISFPSLLLHLTHFKRI